MDSALPEFPPPRFSVCSLFRTFAIPAALACLGLPRAQALIDIGTDAQSGDLTAPANGAPWLDVAEIDDGKGSGVYLGNGFVLTANHVSPTSPVLLDGISYNLDTSFGGGTGSMNVAGVDLKLLRILGNPAIAPVPLIGSSDADLNQSGTIIGWGLGKGTVVTGDGWAWGADSTHAERWGTNTTASTLASAGILQTTFNLAAGPTEAQITEGDSGGGFFLDINGTWKLAGINDGVSTDSFAYYSAPGIKTPDTSAFVEIKPYIGAIEAIIATPEPSTAAMLVTGVMLLHRRRRPRAAPLQTLR